NDGVVLDGVDELGLLLCIRQLAVQQQIGGLQVIGLFRQLFDRVAAVQQDALFTVDVGDLRLARRSRHEAGVEGESARGSQAADIDLEWAVSAAKDVQLDGRSALGDQLRFSVSHE